MGREMTTFRWKKSPQYLNNSTQFRWKMEIHRLDPLPSPVYSKSSTWSILVDRKNPHCGKVWSEPDFNLAYLGGSKNPHGGKKSMGRTRLQLSLFEWIEKSTRWKKKYGPNQTSTQPILVDRKIHTVEKKVWAEPDFDSAYFGGSKNPHGGKRSMGPTRLRLSLFWWIEKSTRWKKKYEPNQTSTQPILVDRKKKQHVTKQVGLLQNVKFWYSTELVSSGENYLNL